MTTIAEIKPDDPLFEKYRQDVLLLKEYFHLNGYNVNDVQRICEACLFDIFTFFVEKGLHSHDEIIEFLRSSCEFKVSFFERMKKESSKNGTKEGSK